MNQIKAFILTVCAVVLLVVWPWQVDVQADVQLYVDNIKMDIDESSVINQPLTNRPIELTGPEQEATFYYEMQSAPADTDHQIVLHYSHSELLIAPSSVTIRIDEEAVLSKPLNGEEKTSKLVVPLTGKALEKGFHQVTIAFSGTIKEGVCVEQGTSGNWFTIGIDSYLKLSGKDLEEPSLTQYPDHFIGKSKRPVFIVMPDQASIETVHSGIQLATFLAEQAEEEDVQHIVRESEIQTLSGNLIVIGAPSEFTSPFIKKLLDQATLPEENDSLTLSRHSLTNGKQSLDVLFVMAASPKDFEKRMAVLMDRHLMKQLSGAQMVIQNLPESKENVNERVIPLKKFGMTSLTLNRNSRESQQFFHYIPFASEKGQAPILELHIKHTEFTPWDFEKTATDIDSQDVELVVLVNDVPHSVNIRQLGEEKEGSYTVQIPIEPNAIQNKRMVSLQFIANGLLTKNPCVATDQNRWIYIDEDSFFTFPKENEKDSNYSLAEFPSPFVDLKENTLIISPSAHPDWDRSLFDLYRSLFIYDAPMQWKLITGDQVTEDLIRNQNLIFIGGPHVYPLLKDKMDQLLVPYSQGLPDLQSFGFLQEAMDTVSYIQPSLWSDTHAMLIFDRLDESKSFLDKMLLDYLRGSEELATVASQSKNRQVFTNSSLLQESPVTAVQGQAQVNSISAWEIIGFSALILFAFTIAFFMIKKRQRNSNS